MFIRGDFSGNFNQPQPKEVPVPVIKGLKNVWFIDRASFMEVVPQRHLYHGQNELDLRQSVEAGNPPVLLLFLVTDQEILQESDMVSHFDGY